jgi:hypothetical protein
MSNTSDSDATKGASTSPGKETATANDVAAGHSPYDVILYLAKSFGSALPVVVIIGLVAVGAGYFIRELTSMQTKLYEAERELNKAKIEKVQAESDAKSAFTNAKGEILAEQAKKFSELNEASVSVSKKIQELVTGQLENMTKLEAQMSTQMKLIKENQNEREKSAKREIESLRTQVTELEKIRKEKSKQVDLTIFEAVRKKLVNESGQYISNELVELLVPTFDAVGVQERIKSDLTTLKKYY